MSATVLSGHPRAAALSRAAVRVIVTVLLAGLFGALTEWSVLHLPDGLLPFSNSAAPWVLVAFLLALTASRVSESVLLGIVALVALTLGFYVAQDLRGWPVSQHQVAFWCASSLVFGPLVGLAAGWLRHRGALTGALGAGIMSGLLVGEGIRGLTTLGLYTPHLYWHAQIVAGLGLAVGLALWACRRRPLWLVPALGVTALTGAATAMVTIAAYQFS